MAKVILRVTRKYRFTSNELKKLLSLEGKIHQINLFRGGDRSDKDIWEIETIEGDIFGRT